MDGLEWKRTKYSSKVQRFLLYAEKLAVKTSDVLVADSLGIKHYLEKKYNKLSTYIPYGTYLFDNPEPQQLERYKVSAFSYSMLIARLEPENSIDVILHGVSICSNQDPFLVIGNHDNKYGAYLKSKYKAYPKIKFMGPEYDIQFLNNLRFFTTLYFHGHTVGGTNPSLLEAMGSHALICAHANEFNKSILGNDAFYFESASEVAAVMDLQITPETRKRWVQANIEKVRTLYLWPQIVEEYEKFFSGLSR
jgi:glycosyltransferase involved in cell wall biosynthesis